MELMSEAKEWKLERKEGEPLEPIEGMSAEEIEKTLMAEGAKKAEKADPLEAAAQCFHMYYPKFCQDVDQLSSRGLRRLLKQLIGHPLEGIKNYSPRDKNEHEAFLIARGLEDAKFVLLLDTYFNNKEHILKAAAQAVAATNEPLEEIKEETNGEKTV